MNKKKLMALTVAVCSTISSTAFAVTADEVKDAMVEGGFIVSEIDATDPTKINYEKEDLDKYNNATTVDFATADGTHRTLTGIVTNATDPNSAANVEYVQNAKAEAVQQANNYTNQKFQDARSYTDNKFQDAKDYATGVGAMAAAMSSIPAPPTGGKGQVGWGVAVGIYHNKTAAAAGLNYDISDTVRAQAKVAMQGSESMVGVGLGGSFGAPTPKQQPKYDDSAIRDLQRRIAELEKQRSIRTTTENYTNMYGHNFVVKNGASGIEMLNLDGTPMTQEQLRKFAEDFAYNNEGREFDYTNFKKNSNGNFQYQDPEVGWLPGSEQAAVGTETVKLEDAAGTAAATRPSDGTSSLRSRIAKMNYGESEE